MQHVEIKKRRHDELVPKKKEVITWMKKSVKL